MADWQSAVIRVWCESRHRDENFKGSAFLINSQWALTDFHVVKELETKQLRLTDAPAFDGDMVSVVDRIDNEELDVTLLKLALPIETDDLVPIALAWDQDLKDKNFEAGAFFSHEGSRMVFNGQVGSRIGVHGLYATTHQTRVDKGMSGGPVLCDGNLAGIIRLRDDTKTYFTPLSRFGDWLRENLPGGVISLEGTLPLSKPKAWIYVLGSTEHNLPQKIDVLAQETGRALAKSGFGLVARGFRGVDHVACREFLRVLQNDCRVSDDWVVKFVQRGREDNPPGGEIVRVTVEDNYRAETRGCTDKADALILIGGHDNSEEIACKALDLGKPVLPFGDTKKEKNFAASKLFHKMKEDWWRYPLPNLKLEEFKVMGDLAPNEVDEQPSPLVKNLVALIEKTLELNKKKH